MRVAAAILAALTLAPAAAAGPPQAGLFLPGKSVGGLALGATRKQVEQAWGRAYGVCRGCAHETWYFNYFAFQPRALAVELRNGRASAIFTIYSPAGWHTNRGLTLGDPVARITEVYGALKRVECGTSYALLLPRGRTQSLFYVLHDRLWAFGLSASGVAVCR